MKQGLKLRGRYDIEIIGLDGKVRKRLVAHNDITIEGIEDLLDTYFGGSGQTDPWAIALIDNAGFSGLANTDTAAVHAGWTENTDYDEAVRQPWDEAAAASEQMTSNTPAAFTMNSDVTLRGATLSSSNVKGGAAGVLFSTAEFDSGPETVANGEIVNISYTVSR